MADQNRPYTVEVFDPGDDAWVYYCACADEQTALDWGVFATGYGGRANSDPWPKSRVVLDGVVVASYEKGTADAEK